MDIDLEPAQLIFLKSKLLGRTTKRAAEDAGVSERTGSAWINDPEILAEYAVMKATAYDSLMDFARSLKRGALRTLNEIRADGAKSDNARINASKAILTAVHEMESEENRVKIAEMEKALNLEAI